MVQVSRYFIKSLARKSLEQGLFTEEELGKFWCRCKSKYIACDNSNGECVIKEFTDLKLLFAFLEADEKPQKKRKRNKKNLDSIESENDSNT